MGTQADMFSVGCVMYAVLTGMPLPRSEAGQVDFDGPFRRLSSEAKTFVQSLLATDPGTRMSAHEALQHPWLSGASRRSLREVAHVQAEPRMFGKTAVLRTSRAPSGCFAGLFRSLADMLDQLEAKGADCSTAVWYC